MNWYKAPLILILRPVYRAGGIMLSPTLGSDTLAPTAMTTGGGGVLNRPGTTTPSITKSFASWILTNTSSLIGCIIFSPYLYSSYSLFFGSSYRG